MVLKIILVVVVELVVVETVVVDTLVVVVAVVAVAVAIVVVIVVAVVIVVVIVVVVVVVVVGTYWLDCSSFIWMKMTFLSSCAVNSCVTAKSNYRIQNYDKKICMGIEKKFFFKPLYVHCLPNNLTEQKTYATTGLVDDCRYQTENRSMKVRQCIDTL